MLYILVFLTTCLVSCKLVGGEYRGWKYGQNINNLKYGGEGWSDSNFQNSTLRGSKVVTMLNLYDGKGVRDEPPKLFSKFFDFP